MSKIGDEIRKVITLSKESMTLSKEIQDCPNQGHGLNALCQSVSQSQPFSDGGANKPLTAPPGGANKPLTAPPGGANKQTLCIL